MMGWGRKQRCNLSYSESDKDDGAHMIEKLLEMADGRWVVPLMVVAGLTALAKALFGMQRSTSQDRRDFLDLWSRRSSDDLWLEVAVRHHFGAYLPASLIRRLQLGPQAGRALLDVATGWDFLDMRDGTDQIHWRATWRESPLRRKWERRALITLYFALAFAGFMSGYFAITAKGGLFGSWIVWLYVVLLVGTAFFCLARRDTLLAAERSMTRWLQQSADLSETPSSVVNGLLAGMENPAESSPQL